MSSNHQKSTGTVRWFDPRKGLGFISNEAGEDVFVHYRAIATGDSYKILKGGQQVEFVQVKSNKGWQAAEVVVIDNSATGASVLPVLAGK